MTSVGNDFRDVVPGSKNFIISARAGEMPANFREISYGNLHISASRQPSEAGILWIFQRALEANQSLYIVDLREEPHFFTDGHAVTYYNGLANDENRGLSPDEINKKEADLIQALKLAGTINVYSERRKVRTESKVVHESRQKDKDKILQLGAKKELSTAGLRSEAKYVRSLEGVKYTRIFFTNHAPDEAIDGAGKIAEVVQEALASGNTWVHFHCHEGRGRASIALLTAHILMQRESSSNLEELVRPLISDERFSNERRKYEQLSESFQKIHTAFKER